MVFNPSTLPSLSGRTYIVTGGNAGIGKFTVSHLAEHGARVYLGARSGKKAAQTIREIKQTVPNADLHVLKMDLMDLQSVRAAAQTFLSKEPELHGLVNNAGIMTTPFEMTKDNYEAQWQTNYMSHWLLTYLLLLKIRTTAGKFLPRDVRIVSLSSMGHKSAPSRGIDFEDINPKKGGIWSRYGM
jgi:NAD(P)-dependent dehydrogenase (short-subunit alcohol dehydrogenase family)